MDRDDALDAFLAVLNVARPAHPGGDVYPLARDDVAYGVTRTYFARCGPSRWWRYEVSYATRMTYINRISRERHLALLVHEVTHVAVGRHSSNQHGSHPRKFWEEMAYHALEVRDSLRDGVLAEVFPDADVATFLEEVVEDPNASTVDRRYWTVDECRARVAGLVGLD